MKRPQVSADDLHNDRTLFPRERLAKNGCEPQTQSEVSRAGSIQRLASSTKVADIGNEGIAPAPHNKLHSKEEIEVSANGIGILRKVKDDKRVYVRSGFALLVRSRFSRVDFSARLRP